MTRLELLDKFCSKARCMHSQRLANALWLKLRPYLTTEERNHLSTAWGHHANVREGPGELDYVRAEIKTRWKRLNEIQ